MLSVDRKWRRRGIAQRLVEMAIEAMRDKGADEIMLETEFDNISSLNLYAKLGFVRTKRLYRFYSNRKDAFRLILPFPPREPVQDTPPDRPLGEDHPPLDMPLLPIAENDESMLSRDRPPPLPPRPGASRASEFDNMYI